MWFEAAFGLKINMEKSSIILVGIVENIESLAREVGCKVGELPTTYLGLPLGANHKVKSVWDGVEERYRKRLALWKRQHISKGGRLTLIRGTLSNMAIYFLSLLQIPRKVKVRLEKIPREFLWGGGALEGKIHLVKWKIVCSNKDKGGLGVICLGTLNKALLAKWAWRFATKDKPLWKKIISLKYGVDKGV